MKRNSRNSSQHSPQQAGVDGATRGQYSVLGPLVLRTESDPQGATPSEELQRRIAWLAAHRGVPAGLAQRTNDCSNAAERLFASTRGTH